jgi:hypothetical protein
MPDVTFRGQFNAATGVTEWVPEDDHDYATELAESACVSASEKRSPSY